MSNIRLKIEAEVNLFEEIHDQLSFSDIWELQQNLWDLLKLQGSKEDWESFYVENEIRPTEGRAKQLGLDETQAKLREIRSWGSALSDSAIPVPEGQDRITSEYLGAVLVEIVDHPGRLIVDHPDLRAREES